MKYMIDRAFIGYFNLLLGASLTGMGWASNAIPFLKAISLLAGIIIMAISGWQIYQKGRLQKSQRKEIEDKENKK